MIELRARSFRGFAEPRRAAPYRDCGAGGLDLAFDGSTAMHTPQVPEPSVGRARSILERVFVPVDLSMDSHRAVGVAFALQRFLRAEVCLFYAAEPDATNDFLGGIGNPATLMGNWLTAAEDRLKRFLHNLVPGYPYPVELRASLDVNVPRLVHNEARAWGASLVIMTADVHARFFRSEAEKMIHDFDIPVLVIPKPKAS